MRLGIPAAVLLSAAFVCGPALAQFDPWGVPADPYQLPPPDQEPYGTPDAGGTNPYEAPQGQDLAPFSGGSEPAPAPAPPVRVENRVAVFSGLDKITGRLTSFDAYVDETVQFGQLQVTPRACYTAPPEETPKTDTFVEIDEITLDRDIRRIFTGWMFADSPGLNAVEHPVYDVWLRDCRSDSDVAPPAG